MPKYEVDVGKLTAIILVLVGVTVLALAGKVDAGTLAYTYGAATGYVFGNGRLAAKGREPMPMIRQNPNRAQRREDDLPT